MAFSRKIHGKSTEAIQAEWRRRIFAGTAKPPAEVEGAGDVLNFVSNMPGAIGYVPASSAYTNANVKVLRVTS